MARQLRHLPGAEVAEDVRGALAQLVLQRVHFGVDVDRRAMAGVAQFLDLGFQIGDGLLEIEVVRIHRRQAGAERGQSSAPRENS